MNIKLKNTILLTVAGLILQISTPVEASSITSAARLLTCMGPNISSERTALRANQVCAYRTNKQQFLLKISFVNLPPNDSGKSLWYFCTFQKPSDRSQKRCDLVSVEERIGFNSPAVDVLRYLSGSESPVQDQINVQVETNFEGLLMAIQVPEYGYIGRTSGN